MVIEEKSRPPFFAVAVLSAAVLAYEVLLTRLFAIIQWHHLAYLAIGLALLGFGASGTFLSLVPRAVARPVAAFAVNAALFGVTAVGCFALAQRLAVNPFEILWDSRQLLRLAAVSLLLAAPFFFAANAIGAMLARFGGQSHRIYAADLAGAGAGALGIVLVLFALEPADALRALGAAGLAAAGLAWVEGGGRPRAWALGAVAAGALLLALPPQATALRLSPYKPLQQALEVTGAKVLARHSGPLGWVVALDNPAIPFREAAGLSLLSPAVPPPQVALFVDGEPAGVVSRFDGRPESAAYLRFLTTAAPYSILGRPRVLVLGAGGGQEVLQALVHGAVRVDAVDLNPDVVELVRGPLATFSGGIYRRPEVSLHVRDARAFVAATDAKYDLIQVAMVDAFGASAAGLHALAESYLYTVEGMGAMLARLAPGGMLAVTRWVTLPPRDMVKLAATAIEALRHSGVNDPERRMVLLRSWKTATLVVRNGPFGAAEIGRMRAFCDARGFDADYFPGARAGDANRYNVAERSDWFDAMAALLGPEAASFTSRYRFDVRPATDDRPYFFHFLEWDTLRELLARPGGAGFPLVEWGYVALLATLVEGALLGALLIVLPLAVVRRRAGPGSGIPRVRVLLYFSALGIAFMFAEIAFIQKLTLLLGHPLYAVAVALAGFLVFAGLGSGYARGRSDARLVRRAVAGIVVIAPLCALLAGALHGQVAHLPDAVRIALALVLIAPLAFLMGMPFPTALAALAADSPGHIPWAWGINGCASVVSAAGATLVAVHFGFMALIGAAVAVYVLAAFSYPEARR